MKYHKSLEIPLLICQHQSTRPLILCIPGQPWGPFPPHDAFFASLLLMYRIPWVVLSPSNSGKWRFTGIPEPQNIIVLVGDWNPGQGDNPKGSQILAGRRYGYTQFARSFTLPKTKGRSPPEKLPCQKDSRLPTTIFHGLSRLSQLLQDRNPSTINGWGQTLFLHVKDYWKKSNMRLELPIE